MKTVPPGQPERRRKTTLKHIDLWATTDDDSLVVFRDAVVIQLLVSRTSIKQLMK